MVKSALSCAPTLRCATTAPRHSLITEPLRPQSQPTNSANPRATMLAKRVDHRVLLGLTKHLNTGRSGGQWYPNIGATYLRANKSAQGDHRTSPRLLIFSGSMDVVL